MFKNIFASLFGVHDAISFSPHEHVCLIKLRVKRYFSHHRATYMIMLRIFKENMQTWMETIEFADLGEKKLRNATN